MGNAASTAFAEAAKRLKSPLPDVEADLQVVLDALLPDTEVKVEDVFSVVTPDDVRLLRRRQPRNLALLLIEAVGVLAAHSVDPLDAKPTRTLNAVRLLTRILPIVFEEPERGDRFVERVFWRNMLPKHPERRSPAAKRASAAAAAAGTAPGTATLSGGAGGAAAPAAAKTGVVLVPEPVHAPVDEDDSEAEAAAEAAAARAAAAAAAAEAEAEAEEPVRIRYERMPGADDR